MQTFKSLNSAGVTLAGIEVAHMIRKRQILRSGLPGFAKLSELADSFCLVETSSRLNFIFATHPRHYYLEGCVSTRSIDTSHTR